MSEKDIWIIIEHSKYLTLAALFRNGSITVNVGGTDYDSVQQSRAHDAFANACEFAKARFGKGVEVFVTGFEETVNVGSPQELAPLTARLTEVASRASASGKTLKVQVKVEVEYRAAGSIPRESEVKL